MSLPATNIKFSDMATTFGVSLSKISLGNFRLLGDPLLPESNKAISVSNFQNRRSFNTKFHVAGHDSRSYPGTGSTWSDLTPDATIVGTLTNASYSATTKGFTFSGTVTSLCAFLAPNLTTITSMPCSIQIICKWDGRIITVNTVASSGIFGYDSPFSTQIHFDIRSTGLRIRLGSLDVSSIQQVPVNQNVLITAVYTGSASGNVLQVYYNTTKVRDAVASATGTIMGPVSSLSTNSFLQIANSTYTGRPFPGVVYNVMIHHVALTATEITSIYNTYKPIYNLS